MCCSICSIVFVQSSQVTKVERLFLHDTIDNDDYIEVFGNRPTGLNGRIRFSMCSTRMFGLSTELITKGKLPTVREIRVLTF